RARRRGVARLRAVEAAPGRGEDRGRRVLRRQCRRRDVPERARCRVIRLAPSPACGGRWRMVDTAQVTILNTGESYECPPSVALRDAGSAAGLHIPHSCRGGAGGRCRAKVVEGPVAHGWVMSFAIPDGEKAGGYCLPCQSKPTAA